MNHQGQNYGWASWSSGFPGGPDSNKSACNVGDRNSIFGSGRFLGEGLGYLRQDSCLGNPMDRGAWCVTDHRVRESDMTA